MRQLGILITACSNRFKLQTETQSNIHNPSKGFLSRREKIMSDFSWEADRADLSQILRVKSNKSWLGAPATATASFVHGVSSLCNNYHPPPGKKAGEERPQEHSAGTRMPQRCTNHLAICKWLHRSTVWLPRPNHLHGCCLFWKEKHFVSSLVLLLSPILSWVYMYMCGSTNSHSLTYTYTHAHLKSFFPLSIGSEYNF